VTPSHAKAVSASVCPWHLAISLQSCVSKHFVINDEWMDTHHPNYPRSPHPYMAMGVVRSSAYTTDVNLIMAPLKDNGFVDMSQRIIVPPDHVGVAAKQP